MNQKGHRFARIRHSFNLLASAEPRTKVKGVKAAGPKPIGIHDTCPILGPKSRPVRVINGTSSSEKGEKASRRCRRTVGFRASHSRWFARQPEQRFSHADGGAKSVVAGVNPAWIFANPPPESFANNPMALSYGIPPAPTPGISVSTVRTAVAFRNNNRQKTKLSRPIRWQLAAAGIPVSRRSWSLVTLVIVSARIRTRAIVGIAVVPFSIAVPISFSVAVAVIVSINASRFNTVAFALAVNRLSPQVGKGTGRLVAGSAGET